MICHNIDQGPSHGLSEGCSRLWRKRLRDGSGEFCEPVRLLDDPFTIIRSDGQPSRVVKVLCRNKWRLANVLDLYQSRADQLRPLPEPRVMPGVIAGLA